MAILVGFLRRQSFQRWRLHWQLGLFARTAVACLRIIRNYVSARVHSFTSTATARRLPVWSVRGGCCCQGSLRGQVAGGVTLWCVAVILAVAAGILAVALGAPGVLFKPPWPSLGWPWPECRASNSWRISCVDRHPSRDVTQLDEQLGVMECKLLEAELIHTCGEVSSQCFLSYVVSQVSNPEERSSLSFAGWDLCNQFPEPVIVAEWWNWYRWLGLLGQSVGLGLSST